MNYTEPTRKLRLLPLLALVASLAVAYGCGERRDSKTENAGETIDETVEDAKEGFKKDGPAEDAGEKLDDATN
jgi:hypothetical protein